MQQLQHQGIHYAAGTNIKAQDPIHYAAATNIKAQDPMCKAAAADRDRTTKQGLDQCIEHGDEAISHKASKPCRVDVATWILASVVAPSRAFCFRFSKYLLWSSRSFISGQQDEAGFEIQVVVAV
jgi:hypothetical protein